jgi:hypothetical protein
MPRYFFNTIDGRRIPDDEGTDLPNLSAVRAEATRVMGELLKEQPEDLWRSPTRAGRACSCSPSRWRRRSRPDARIKLQLRAFLPSEESRAMESGNEGLARLVAELRRAVIGAELRRGRPPGRPAQRRRAAGRTPEKVR